MKRKAKKKTIKRKISPKQKSLRSKMERIDSFLEKIKKYKKEYLLKKKKERNVVKRIVDKFSGAQNELKEQWIDEVVESKKVKRWLKKIDEIVDQIYDEHNKDKTEYVDKKLDKIFLK